MHVSAGLTMEGVLSGAIAASLDSLEMDELVSAVRWTKGYAIFALFIGLCTFCGHLRWRIRVGLGVTPFWLKVPSLNEVREKPPLHSK